MPGAHTGGRSMRWAMWAWIAFGLLVLGPGLVVWWTIRHPASPDAEPPRPKMNKDDLWLAETYGLNLMERTKVRDAAMGGVIVDPDNLRPIVVAFAHRLLERR